FSFFFSSRRRHTRSLRDWSSDVCSSDLDSIAAINDPAAIGLVHVLIVVLALSTAVIVVKRLVRVIALNQASAGRIVLRDGQQERSEERRVGKECRARRWRCQ